MSHVCREIAKRLEAEANVLPRPNPNLPHKHYGTEDEPYFRPARRMPKPANVVLFPEARAS